MSLFGHDGYHWRETYFLLLRAADRPTLDQVIQALTHGNEHYQLQDETADNRGHFESLTVLSPEDHSAMDITYVVGEEVTDQIDELSREIAKSTLTEADRRKLAWLQQCDARIDVFHFESVSAGDSQEEEFLDPGSLIIVIKRLARLCHGVGVDPQSGLLM